MPQPRRLPAPWRVETLPACFKVLADDGTAVAHVYFDDPPIVGTGDKLDRETARRVAAQIARIPERRQGAATPAKSA